MALMTQKMMLDLYNLQGTAATDLPIEMSEFVRASIRGIYATAEDFDSRKELRDHIHTLRTLITNEIQRRS